MATLVLPEHGRLSLDFAADEIGAFRSSLRGAPVRIEATEAGFDLVASHDVGWLPFRTGAGSGVIVIVPKGSRYGEEDEAVARFFDIVLVAQGLGALSPGEALTGWGTAGVSGLWPIVVGRSFLHALEDLVRNDLRKGYAWRSENLVGRVRGRLHTMRHLALTHRGRGHHMPCTWDEFDWDHLDNRILKAAARVVELRRRALAEVVQERRSLPSVPGWVSDALEAVPDVGIVGLDLERSRAGLRSHRYERALGLARMLLRSSSGATTGNLAGWTINANKAFEELSAQIAERVALRLDLKRTGQRFPCLPGVSPHLMRVGGDLERNVLRPDIVLHDGHSVVALGDAKYKELFEDREASLPTSVQASTSRLLGLVSADLYQVFVYLRAARCPCGFFVVPYWDGRSGVAAAEVHTGLEFAVAPLDSRPVRLAVLGLNLMAPASKIVKQGAEELASWVVAGGAGMTVASQS